MTSWLIEYMRNSNVVDGYKPNGIDHGYKVNENGICFGIASMAKQAILLGEFDKFIARLELIEQDFKGLLGRKLTEQEKTDVFAFLDGVQLYQSPEKHLELFENKINNQQSKAKEVFDIINLLKFQENYVTHGFSGCYTIKELMQYLQILEETICNCCQDCNDVPDNINFQLSANKHTIILNYNIKNKFWNIIDANILGLGVSYFKKLQDRIKELRNLNNADAMIHVANWLFSCFGAEVVEEVSFNDEGTAKLPLVEEVNSDNEEEIVTTKPPLVEEINSDDEELNINQLKLAMYTEAVISNKFSAFKNKFIEKLNNNNTWKLIHTITNNKISLDKIACSWLYIAVRFRDFEKAKLLIEKLIDAGYKVDQTNDKKIPLLLLAVNNGDVEMVKLLIDNKANVNQVDDEDTSPLLVAVESGYYEMVKLLIDNKANIELCNDRGFSSLRIAARRGYTKIVKLLIDADAKINDQIGVFSPLWAAAENGHANIIEMLIEKGANINEVNWQNVSYLDVAVRNSHVEVAELLAKDATIGILKQAKQNISQNSKSTELLEDIINKAIEKAILKHKEPILLRSISSNSNKKQNAVCEEEISMEIRQNSKTI